VQFAGCRFGRSHHRDAICPSRPNAADAKAPTPLGGQGAGTGGKQMGLNKGWENRHISRQNWQILRPKFGQIIQGWCFNMMVLIGWFFG